MALEYLLKGPTASGAQVTADVKAKLSDEHVKVCCFCCLLTLVLFDSTISSPTAGFPIVELRKGALGDVA